MYVKMRGDRDVPTDHHASNNRLAIFGYQLSPLEPVQPTSRTRSLMPSATPSRTPSPDSWRHFRLPVVTNRSGTPTNRVRPRSPSRTPPSPDGQEYLQNPPSYEGVSQRPEEHPSDTGPPPPSYEEVMTGSFTEIQIEGSDECANQRQEQSQDSHRSV